MEQLYKEFGFVNTKKIYAKALKHHYAIPGYNFNTLEQVIAITQACVKTSSPVLLQYYAIPGEMLPLSMVVHAARGAVQMAADMGNQIEIALHLDHGHSFEQCKQVIDAGFSSVMIDGSTLPFDKNVELTRKVVQYAHERDVTVEGELGKISGGEDVHGRIEQQYTRPEEAKTFTDATGVDSLAVSVGTVHGAYKFALKPGEVPPPLRCDILEQIKKLMPGLPIVLHGASSVPKEYIALINAFGGKMDAASGVPEEQLMKAISINVAKVNIHSDSQVAMTGTIREHMSKKPADFDPRTYLDAARQELVELYTRKNRDVLKSTGMSIHS